MPNTVPPFARASGFRWIALWAPLVITACGGGGSGDGGMASGVASTAGSSADASAPALGSDAGASVPGVTFRDACGTDSRRVPPAGLPHCTFHGLRKCASVRLAEHGCTPHEIAAITGHATLREIERYTKGASRRRLAVSAMAKLRKVSG